MNGGNYLKKKKKNINLPGSEMGRKSIRHNQIRYGPFESKSN